MAVLPERRELGIVEVPEPTPRGARDVTVRMREVGVCATDREICAFHHGTPPAGHDALVLGHEGLGEVTAVGPAVQSLLPGDLVVPMVRRPCDEPSCMACRAGRQDHCASGLFRERGINGSDGFMTELVVDDERYLVPVPRALASVGVLVEPLSIAVKAVDEVRAVQRRLPWEPGRLRALVLGAGPIGLLGAMTLVARGAETVVYSREPSGGDRARLARSIGAGYVSAEDTPPDAIAGASVGGRFDVILEAVGVARVVFDALGALAPNGVCVLGGVPGGGATSGLDLDCVVRRIVLRNQVLVGTVNASRAQYTEAVRDLERFMALFPDAVRALITARVPLERAPDVLRRRGGLKQVVALSAS